jgi:hypothetical protein
LCGSGSTRRMSVIMHRRRCAGQARPDAFWSACFQPANAVILREA